MDAFESLHLDNPRVDRYCFMTTDSDFTVIADKLRKFGREVWLVCKKSPTKIERLSLSHSTTYCSSKIFFRKKDISVVGNLDKLFLSAPSGI
ncbi:NYN domain-containing protein [Vibrio sinaloensis]|nr:NYN domain-containing protein [Vibrio sinaloensis]